MTIKRAPPRAPTLTVEEHRRVVQVVTLLVAVSRRVGNSRAKTRGASLRKKHKQGPQIRGPCFFARRTYHGDIDFDFNAKVITMIDTIVLIFSSDMYQITDAEKFTPSARWITNPALITAGIRSKQNVTQKELRQGIYKPYLTLYNAKSHTGHRDILLKVELSLPKLMFGNNFEELQYKDFATINRMLTEQLESMGVKISTHTLAQAPVAAIHYAKNIELKDGSTPYHYLQAIKESNASLALDTNSTDYRNDGLCYKWHCNAYEVVFYDKIKELEKAKHGNKRTIEKDGALQLKLLEKLAHRHHYEILRMEVRLNKRQKMKQLFAKLGIKADLTFKALFKPAIAKKVLLHSLNVLASKRPALLDFNAKNDGALLTSLCLNNPDLGPKQIFQMFGLKKALDIHTPRELRLRFAKFHPRSWARLMTDAKKVQLPTINQPLSTIRNQIAKFKPSKL